MPIYEYTCPACGAAEEKLEPLSAPASHDCPQCGAAQGMARQLSVAAVATSTPSMLMYFCYRCTWTTA